MRCKDHPDYTGDHRPQSNSYIGSSADCVSCWLYWLDSMDSRENVRASDLHTILTLVMTEMNSIRHQSEIHVRSLDHNPMIGGPLNR